MSAIAELVAAASRIARRQLRAVAVAVILNDAAVLRAKAAAVHLSNVTLSIAAAAVATS